MGKGVEKVWKMEILVKCVGVKGGAGDGEEHIRQYRVNNGTHL